MADDEIEILDPEDGADGGSASSTSQRPKRRKKSTVQFDASADESASSHKKKATKKAQDPVDNANPDLAASSGANPPTAPSEPPAKKKRNDTEAALCVWRNWEQTPPKGAPEDFVKTTPWNQSVKYMKGLLLIAKNGTKLPLKAGDSVWVWSLKKTAREIEYTICWFDQANGEQRWSMELLGLGGDRVCHTKVAAIIRHQSRPEPTREDERKQHKKEIEDEHKEARGSTAATAARRLNTAHKGAKRSKPSRRQSSLVSNEVFDQLDMLNSTASDIKASSALFTVHLGDLKTAVARLDMLASAYESRLKDLDAFTRGIIQANARAQS